MRPRVCHGIHNGAHLDHLAALTAEAPLRGAPSPIEFGAGLLAAESYAMAVELLAAAECTVSGLTGEARQLRHGLVERIGRHPGYAHWCAGLGNGKRALTGGSDRSVTSPSGALAEAASTRVGEFGALPTLASNYVTGPLSLIGGGHGHPFVPGALLTRFQDRWCAVADRFPPAALLTRRARALT
jgi:hypothetical protein